MRISLKWMLLIVTYMAVAVAACVQQGTVLRAVVWMGNAFAIFYSLLAVCYFRGRSQAIAAGFGLFAIAGTSFSLGFPTASPIADLVRPLASSSYVTSDELLKIAQRAERLAWEMNVSTSAGSPEYRLRAQQEYAAAKRRMNGLSSIEALVESIETACVMVAGLIGCFVGNHIWKVSQKRVVE